MTRKVLCAVLVLVLGLLLGTFIISPLLTPTATAQEKKPPDAGKGKCVGVSSVFFKESISGKEQVVFCRAFEDGTVEILEKSAAGLPASWPPDKK
jgi:hypothetical protein